MNKRIDNQSIDKLQDALGMIDDAFLKEAHEELDSAQITAKNETQETAGVEREEQGAEKTDDSTIKWKRISRRGGILIAAACVIILAAAVILIPKNGSQGTTENMAALSATEAAAEAEYEAAYEMAEAEGYYSDGELKDNAAFSEPAGAVANSVDQQDEAAEAPAEAAEEAAMESLTNDGKGFAVRYDRELVNPNEKPAIKEEYDYPDGLHPKDGLIIKSREQLEDYFVRTSYALRGPIQYDGAEYQEVTEIFDEEFFKEKNVAISFMKESSGAYSVTYLSTEENGNTAEVHYTVYQPDRDPSGQYMVTADMADWMLFSVVSKDVEKTETVRDDYPY